MGSNEESQLGVRQRSDALAPTRVTALEQFQVQRVACGPAHTLAVVDGGAVAAFGSAEYGQVGLGPCGARVELPRVVKDLRSMHIVRVAAGGSHTLALSSTGGVFSCGNGSFGALGRGTTEGVLLPACGGVLWPCPRCCPALPCPALPCPGLLHGLLHGLVLFASLPACSATDLLGSHGAGNDVPRPISRLWPLGVVQIACGENHSAAITADGRVLTWGRGKHRLLPAFHCGLVVMMFLLPRKTLTV